MKFDKKYEMIEMLLLAIIIEYCDLLNQQKNVKFTRNIFLPNNASNSNKK